MNHFSQKVSVSQACLKAGRVVIATLLALFLVMAAVPSSTQAWAADTARKASLQEQRDALYANIDELQDKLNTANADYQECVDAHDAAVAAMEAAQARMEEAQARIDEIQPYLNEHAVLMYKMNGGSSFLDVLLGSSSFSEFLTNFDAIQRVIDKDMEMISESKALRAEAQAAREEYAAQEVIAAEKMERSLAIKQEIEETHAAMMEEMESITSEIADIEAEEELEAAAAEAARQAAAAAGDANGGYEAGDSVVTGTGQFTHPCPSAYISSGFGYRTFDNSFHKGTDFAASEGTPYYAADSGTVIYATNDGGYNGGAGNWVVIAHGNGLVTKYMHSSAVFVSPGQSVSRGQNIGLVGNTGASFGAHLHFQVEVNGTAVNAMGYL